MGGTMISRGGREASRMAKGLAFIAPNIAGFLVFTLFPLVFSFAMAFTNWDIQRHNMYNNEALRFVGLENLVRLFGDPDFFKYLGNTFFLMMGMPFGIAGSLGAALLLSRDLSAGGRRVWAYVLLCVSLTVGIGALIAAGAGATAMTILVCGVAGAILVTGSLGGKTVYRTLFYFPHFTAGVATFLLWKKLYNPHTGPFNNALRPLLESFGGAVNALPAGLVRSGAWACAALAAALALIGARNLRRAWLDGEMGTVSVSIGTSLLCVPAVLAVPWAPDAVVRLIIPAAALAAAALIVRTLAARREFACALDEELGHAVISCGGIMTAQLALLGLGIVLFRLPEMSAAGLAPPEWLTQYHWSKPSLMIMGLWAAVGSNSMLLYLAGISNIPPELYEAADVDGASPLQRFLHITWPQLAPITFFILIMAIIHGLQGGFEMARTMTQGGPAGATTTLSYYVYTEGFETGRLGYASAVAWALFALVFTVTVFNWKFGNRYVND